jgi:hypothetical protein
MVCTEQPVQRELRFWLFYVPVSLLFECTPYTSRMKYNIVNSANIWDGDSAVCRDSLRAPEFFLYFYAAETSISRSWLWCLFEGLALFDDSVFTAHWMTLSVERYED